jgi:chemosensory pili system protein ChpA (sensor histidine kinase/response regulator)
MSNTEISTKNQPQKSLHLQPKFRTQFHKQVLVKLSEILEISEQENPITHKSEIHKLGDEISLLGRKAQIPSWGEVLTTAKRILNQESDNYQQVIKIVVQEIKNITELVLHDRCHEITISKQLKQLTKTELQPEKSSKITNTEDKLDMRNHRELRQVNAQDLNSLADVFEGYNESSNLSKDYQNSIFSEITTEGNEELKDIFAEELGLIQINHQNPEEDRKKKNVGKDTMLLFGEEFSFEDLELEQEIVPKTTAIKSGEVFGDELSLNLKPKSRKTKKQFISKDTTNLFGKDFSFDVNGSEGELIAQNNESPDLDLDINDLFADEILDTAKSKQEEDHFSDLELELNDLFEEQDSSPESDFTDLFDSLEMESETSSLGEMESGELDDLISEKPPEEKEEITYFYESWEDLEELIISPPAQQDNFKVENLLRIIEAPILESNLGSQTEISQEEDDYDFAELEQMLQQSIPNLAGSGTLINNATANKSIFEQTMKVPVKQLDNLNNLIGELVVNKNSLEQDQERMRQFLENLLNHVGNLSELGARMQDLYERSLLESSLLATTEGVKHIKANQGNQHNNSHDLNHDYDPLEMDRFTGFHLLSQETIELIVRVRESSSDIQFLVDETEQISRNLRQITSQLQEGLNKSRMVAFAETADRMRAAVRRVSVQLKKQAELVTEGRDVLIDKMIAEHLFDPMTHLVNNALTHGIETPEERERKGKNPVGKITINAYVQGNQTVITVADDGAGINAEVVKRKAVEKGLISRYQSQIMSEKQAFDLIFQAGFTTKERADDFAGRGVGMDVVRTALNEIRGTISIDSTINKGTTFTIRLPLMLTISKALCCLSAHHRIAFPMDGVEDRKDFFPAEIKTNEQGEKIISWRNNLIPFKPLTELLKYNRQIGRSNVYGGKREDDMISIVILRSGGNYFAVQVDQVLSEQEIVIKQIQGPVPKSPGIAGATVLGDGRIMAIVDVLELFDIAQGRIRHEVGGLWDKIAIEPSESEVRTEPMVLIVDDSITVRGMLSMTFTKAGYRVEEARDGQEAWDKLHSGLPCDMVFCDIEMPRMDGLQLLSKIQQDEELNHLPVAMLTSRGADKHKQLAAKLGASAYFTKPFLEEALLDGAGRMMKGEVLLINSTRKPGKQKPQSQLRAEEKQKDQSSSVISSINEIPTVLIIDDSVVVRELLSSTFQNAGYQVEQARDGQEAWDKLNDDLHCNVIFCDIEMPRMNGLDLLANLQTHEELNKIPVAMLTSRGAERHRRLAAERGAKGYFTKPYMDEVLLEAAQRLMNGEVLIPVNN